MFLLMPVLVSAQSQSVWTRGLVPCTGLDCSVCDVFELISRLISFLWSAAALIGTFMFMYGGYLYWRNKPAEAKKVLTNTLIGIALAFLAWIGIDTIIKLLVTQRFGGEAANLPQSVEGGVVKYGPWNKISCQAPATPATTGQGLEKTLAQPGKNLNQIIAGINLTEQEAEGEGDIQLLPPGVSGENMDADEEINRNILGQAGISVNNPDWCPVGLDYRVYKKLNGKSCTSVGGLPDKTIQDLVRLKENCDKAVGRCTMVVSGGSEAGHKSHGPGKPVVDLRFDQKLADYLTSEAVKRDFGIQKICTTRDDSRYSHNCYGFYEYVRHLHVVFSL